MGGLKTISIIVAANIKGLESGLGKANKSLSKFASSSARLGSMMTFGLTAPLAAMGKVAFDTFSKFEDGMTRVRTVTGASVGDFKMLTEEAKRLGATTQFTASQVADLQLVLGRKGFDPTQIKNMEKSILDLALATGEDLSLAAETVSTSINAFGLESTEAARVANTLASAAANSSIQLSTFSTAFGHAGASASAVGVDLEELSAMMGVLMDNGIKASKAGTGLRKIFMKLSRDGTDFTKVLDLATQGEMGLKKAMKLAGVTSANQLLILAKNKDKVAELTAEYKNNTGRLKEMTDLMGKTTKAKIKKMESAIEGLKIEFGALIADAISPMITWVTDLAREFSALDSNTKNMIIRIGGIVGIVGPILITFGALLSLLNPISIGLIAVTAGIAAVGLGTKESLSPLKQQNSELNALARAAMSAAEGSEKRLYYLDQIREKHPDFLTSIDAETTSNENLKTALDNVNDAYIVSARVQAGLEQLKEKTKAYNDEKVKQFDLETLAWKAIGKTGAKFDENLSALDILGKMFRETDPLIRAVTGSFVNLGIGMAGMSGQGAGGNLDKYLLDVSNGITSIHRDDVQVLRELYNQMTVGSKTYEEAKSALDRYTAALTEAQKAELGLTSTTPTPVPTKSGGGGKDPKPTRFEDFSVGLQGTAEKIVALGEVFADTFGMMGEIFSQFIANKQIENENWYGREKELIDKSLKSEEEKANDLQDLDKEMAAKTAALKKKQAKADKAQAIFNAIINTAAAVSKVAFNPILAAVVAGLGAVQIASIAAQPIPAFADGGNPPVGKVSLVGERGPELFVPKSQGTIIPNEMLGGGGGVQRVEVFGSLDSEGIQIATLQGNKVAKQKGGEFIWEAGISP